MVVPESAQVIPCTDYKILDDSNKQYNAFLYNIYFSNGKYMLRKEDGSYTETFNEQYSSSGLNRIPVNSEYNSVSFIFVVSGNNLIVKVTGLSEMLLSFHTGQIEDSLGIVVDITDLNIENISYAEDWKLRKEIIDYLNEAQYDMYKPIVVPEPKNYFRRLDEYSDIDWFELTMLFVIKTEDGFGIIWENIDLTEDRASYVFKSMSENLSEQLDKIADSIKTLAQFRSSLISNKEHEYDRKMLSLFKNNLGYTGTIRKKRGKNKPFGDWLNKIETLLSCAIPAIPSEAELIELKKWNPKIQHHAKINSFTPIDYNRLTNVDTKILDEENEFNAPEVELINNSFENILISLKSFNDIFLKDFKI